MHRCLGTPGGHRASCMARGMGYASAVGLRPAAGQGHQPVRWGRCRPRCTQGYGVAGDLWGQSREMAPCWGHGTSPHTGHTGLALVWYWSQLGLACWRQGQPEGGGQHGSDQQASHERGRAAGSSLNKRSFVWGMFCLSQQHPGWVPPTGRATPSPGTAEAWAGGTWWCRGMATCLGWDAQSWALPGQPLLPGPFCHPSAHQPTCSPAIQRRR